MNRLIKGKKPHLRRTLKHRNPEKLKKLFLAILITLFAALLYIFYIQPNTYDAKQQLELQHKTQVLQQTVQQLDKQKTLDKTQQKKLDDLNKQLQDTQKKLEAKRAAAVAYAAELPPPVRTDGPVANCGDNSYAHDIYMNESGCQTHNPNGSGCDGIGQACPAGKVTYICGYDYTCQNKWFTAYAISRYGGWEQADYAWHHQYDAYGNHWW